MRLLITGGAGYIGSALVSYMPAKHEIICLDHGRLFTKFKEMIRENVRLVKGDVTDKNLLEQLMPGVDTVIHLAGGGGNARCMGNPSEAVMTHVYGTHLLLQKALHHNIKRFIFASTVSVYTTFREREMPLMEDMELRPDDLYGALKAVAEYEIRDSGVSYVVLRFANVYGYGSGLHDIQPGGAINNFIRAACNESDITIFGNGKQEIDYVHISDVCNCVMYILESAAIENEIFNMGSGALHSIEEIAKIVSDVGEKVYKHKTRIKRLPAPEGKVWPDRLMSIEKITCQLGQMPQVALREGIYEMMTKHGGC
jgi:nucleoside-diphosphate-sugar epimerase